MRRSIVFLLLTAATAVPASTLSAHAATSGAGAITVTYRGCGTKIVRSITFRRDQTATFWSTGPSFRLLSLSKTDPKLGLMRLIVSTSKHGQGFVPGGTHLFKISAGGPKACWTVNFRRA